MKLGFVSDSLGGISLTEMLDHAARMGVSGVEVNHLRLVHRPAFRPARHAGRPPETGRLPPRVSGSRA